MASEDINEGILVEYKEELNFFKNALNDEISTKNGLLASLEEKEAALESVKQSWKTNDELGKARGKIQEVKNCIENSEEKIGEFVNRIMMLEDTIYKLERQLNDGKGKNHFNDPWLCRENDIIG